MHFLFHFSFCPTLLVTGCFASLSVAQQPPPTRTGAAEYAVLSRIRQEGLRHSHVLEYGRALSDELGPRLTGSPEFRKAELWAIEQLRTIGVLNAREESWGTFGLAWTSLGTSLWMVEPSAATFSAQATPWSPATGSPLEAAVVLVPEIRDVQALEQWHGILKGKIILYGHTPPIQIKPGSPLFQVDDDWLRALDAYPVVSGRQKEENIRYIRQVNFDEQVCSFFAKEGALAILRSRGEGATFVDDTSLTMGWYVYQPSHRQCLPSAAVAPDAYGRMARLILHNIPVSARLEVRAQIGPDAVSGENVLAEIPGSDPILKQQVVMIGGHLDSWSAATGATDNGAGVAIALEAIRILKAARVQPRRTIRIGLWSGEEQGSYGSLGYVQHHLATFKYADIPEENGLPPGFRTLTDVSPSAGYADFDVYFNVDNGDGRFLGINAEDNLAAARLFSEWIPLVSDLGFTTVTLRQSEDTDHVSFDSIGLPGFQFLQDRRQDSRTHHTNLDTFERLSEADMKQAATILAIFAYKAAQRDDMMPRKQAPFASNGANLSDRANARER